MRHSTHLRRLAGRRSAPAIRGPRLAARVAAAALGLAACGGSGGPHVASLPASNARASTSGATTPATRATTSKRDNSSAPKSAKGNPTALMDEWATCMHSHGDPNQADPTVDAYGVINVTIPAGAEDLSNAVHGGTDPCNQYVAAAQSALRAAHPVAPPPDQAEQVKYVNCMRANGVPNYPYPTGNKGNFNGTGVDPTSPAVVRVNNLCGRKLNLPAWWIAGTGNPGDVSVSSAGIGPNGPVNGAVPNRPRPAQGGNGAASATPVAPGG
jgi:hypothetical protein